MSWIKRASAVLRLVGLSVVGGCSGSDKLLGSDGSTVISGGSGGGGGAPAAPLPPPEALGVRCIPSWESLPYFRGYSVKEIDIEQGGAECETNICLMNHFQGRVSCPYGQAAGASDCLLPDGSSSVAGAVVPQLVSRQAAVAAICSCRCDGDGPGPYCTCPESMQCEHLVDDLGLGHSELAGSYCIPKGSQYDPRQVSEVCVAPNCGPAHPI